VAPLRGAGFSPGRVLRLEPGDVRPDRRIVPVFLQKGAGSSPRKAEQGTVDEIDRCGGALDVQQDGADLAQLEAVRSGMYAGPMQRG
jgi:hypothetical protein